MNAFAFQLLQGFVLAIVLLFSLAMTWRKLMPHVSRRVLARCARALGRPGRGALAQRVSKWLQPAEATAGACGDGSGCSGCSGCTPVRDPHVMPITIKRRSGPH
jgi:hypothetical protein